jgi:hypothetical protein
VNQALQWIDLAQFLFVFFHNQPLVVASPTTTIRCQKGNCFEMSIVLCSLLIGAGYDAYCVCGYATREVTLMDQTRDICPLLKQENKVSWLHHEYKSRCVIGLSVRLINCLDCCKYKMN